MDSVMDDDSTANGSIAATAISFANIVMTHISAQGTLRMYTEDASLQSFHSKSAIFVPLLLAIRLAISEGRLSFRLHCADMLSVSMTALGFLLMGVHALIYGEDWTYFQRLTFSGNMSLSSFPIYLFVCFYSEIHVAE
jgi:hypothetical protein